MTATSLSTTRNTALPLLLASTIGVSADTTVVQHDLTVDLDPGSGQIEVVDRIRVPGELTGAGNTVDFYLNSAFEPALIGSNSRLEADRASAVNNSERRYRVRLAADSSGLTLSYGGKIAQADGAYERGHVGEQGVYLTGTSAWYPILDDSLVTFSIRARAPEGWSVISQGVDAEAGTQAAPGTHFWRETRPQTDIVLLAGRYAAYKRRSAGLDTRVYLRNHDPALAGRYLEATAHYVDLYARLLGPYPYEKFALVENFWETGYGMPTLALLGPRVIRFPFILHSSFPHEILHNWWGNGVYLEPGGGNWSEGLTAYLADHLVQEQRGRGADYRRAALQKYASYVDAADDFPLSAFRGKHGEVSQAVGYNKALMFFHMLRQRLGDTEFLDGLRQFTARNRFQRAGYDDLRRAFEAASGLELSFEFQQWVERTGAPQLSVDNVVVESEGESHRVKGVIAQQQPGLPYRLRVPVAVQLDGRANAVRKVIPIETRREQFELELSSRPVALHLDPEFDLFRRLAPGEVPASLGDLLGARDTVFVLPEAETAGARDAYAGLVRILGGNRTKNDSERFPARGSVWLLGWDNAHLDALGEAVAADGVAFTPAGLRLGDDVYERGGTCVVMAAREVTNTGRIIGFIGCDNPRAVTGLARKIPHYGRYGFLVFSGDEPVNVRKDEWPVRESPMTVGLDPQRGAFPPRLPTRRPLSAQP
ncbi:MAG TPA: M1 family aminopeptidase [Gammaproteobacteria bacterium]|nr:M1 family aminopeptidase [Gammaproteobacteria bacterium]